MKKLLAITILFSSTVTLLGKVYQITSPDVKLKVELSIKDDIRYSLSVDDELLLQDCKLELITNQETTKSLKVKKISQQLKEESIESPFYKTPKIKAKYNDCIIELNNRQLLEFAVFNEGMAYRFSSKGMNDSDFIVENENVEFNFTQDRISFIPYSTNPKNPWAMAFQATYDVDFLSKQNKERIGFLPVTIDCSSEKNPHLKVTLMESDVEHYPGMFIQPSGTSLKGRFSQYPKSFDYYAWRIQKYVTSKENYIAKCRGDRTFPWRIIGISYNDTEMPMNNLVYILASPNRIGDTSWVKPGKVAWDWWNDWGITGVDFKAGINMSTYKYYIDFASKYGLEYIILDEGWYAPKSGDMMKTIDDIDLPELVMYARSKGVKIILWTVFNVLNKDLEAACQKYSAMGIAGFKVDFLDRNDQEAVEMSYRIAETCAHYKLLLDFHGFYPPTGLNRTYPNILNFESVFGMEEVKWTEPNTKDMPMYDVTFPFIRLQSGPVDFTPGGMRNATQSDFKPINNNPMTMGTRCHQMAMYVIHDSPLTMLADSPTSYEREPEFTSFLSKIPVLWDETRILSGEIGKYIVTARRKGENWYIAGQTNWNPKEACVPLTFLSSGKYLCILYQDGLNAEKNASDYKLSYSQVNSNTELKVEMASGGGFLMKLEPMKTIM